MSKKKFMRFVSGAMAMIFAASTMDIPTSALENHKSEIDMTTIDKSTILSQDGRVKMQYVPEDEVSLADSVGVDNLTKIFHELDKGYESSDFFNDCGADYGYKSFSTKENGDAFKKLYVRILSLMEECYFSTEDVEKSDFSGHEYCCIGKAEYKTLGLTNEEIFQVYLSVLYDHPLVYFGSNTIMYDGSELYIFINESFASGDVRNEYSQKVSAIMEEFQTLTSNAQSNYEIVKLVHDKIACTVDYAYESDGMTPKNNDFVHNISGYLSDEKEVVCDGYSKTFGAVLNYLDIENIFVSGWGVKQGDATPDGKGHAWNMVRLGNGKYYFVDVTYDDGGKYGVFDNYLCIGTDIFNDHSVLKKGESNYSYYMYDLPDCPSERFSGLDSLVKADDPEYVDEDATPCGDNVFWKLDEDGIMTIYGKGEMWDFQYDETLCEEQKNDVKEVIFKSGVTSIGEAAFYNFKNLESVTFPDTLREIGAYAFGCCENIGGFTFPDELECIGDGAFEYCKKITSISIPDSVENIGTYMCEGDCNLTYVYIGGKKGKEYTCGIAPFIKCSSLEKIEVSQNNDVLCGIDGVLYSKKTEESDMSLIQYPSGKKENVYTVADDTVMICESAIESAQYVKNIVMPAGLEEICDMAINDCPNLENLVIPSNVKKIGSSLGFKCPNLQYIENHSNSLFTLGENVSLYELDIDADKKFMYFKNTATSQYVSEIYEGKLEAVIKGDIVKKDESFEIDNIVYCMKNTPKNLTLGEMNDGETVGEVYVLEIKDNQQIEIPDKVEYRGWIYKVLCEDFEEPTTQEPTTQEPTTQEPTTQEPTTQEPTTQEPTTQEPTTQEPTTQEPTTQEPTTQEPTTQEPTTEQSTKSQTIKVSKSYKKVYGDKSFKLNAKLVKGDGKLTYSSSDKKVATVSSAGKVAIKGTGICTITVKASSTENYKKAIAKIKITVTPKKNKVSKLKVNKNKSLTVMWTRDKNATGYEVQYSASKKFSKKNMGILIVNKNKTTSCEISKLQKNKKYYIRVRAYKKIKSNGKTKFLYGAYSVTKRSGKIK